MELEGGAEHSQRDGGGDAQRRTPRRASSSETAVLQSLEAFQHVLGKNFPGAAIDTLVAGRPRLTTMATEPRRLVVGISAHPA